MKDRPKTAVPIVVTPSERAVLKCRVDRIRTEQRDVVRAQIVLSAAAQRQNAQIAPALNICADTVLKWRGRFVTDRLDGLKDRPRRGRPPLFGAAVEAKMKALA